MSTKNGPTTQIREQQVVAHIPPSHSFVIFCIFPLSHSGRYKKRLPTHPESTQNKRPLENCEQLREVDRFNPIYCLPTPPFHLAHNKEELSPGWSVGNSPASITAWALLKSVRIAAHITHIPTDLHKADALSYPRQRAITCVCTLCNPQESICAYTLNINCILLHFFHIRKFTFPIRFY